jgi:hypothetical protein
VFEETFDFAIADAYRQTVRVEVAEVEDSLLGT